MVGRCGIISLVMIIIVLGCVETKTKKKNGPKIEYSLPENIKIAADSLGRYEGICDQGYCFENDRKQYRTIKDSSSLEELQYVYYQHPSSKAFKYRVFELLYERDSSNRKKLFESSVGDTTAISHSSGCMGISYSSTFEEDCYKLVYEYANREAGDSILIDIILNKAHFYSLSNALKHSITRNFDHPDLKKAVKRLSRTTPEALIKYSQYLDHDTTFVAHLLDSVLRAKDTSYFLAAAPLMMYAASSEYHRIQYQSIYEDVILNLDLHKSDYRLSRINSLIETDLHSRRYMNDPAKLKYNGLSEIVDILINKVASSDDYSKKMRLDHICSLLALFNEIPHKFYKANEIALSRLDSFYRKINPNYENESCFMHYHYYPGFGLLWGLDF